MREPPPPRRSPLAPPRWLLGLIVLGAAALRLWRLDRFPPGLSVDEAYNLLDARGILDGARPLFLPDNAGREALYSYWQAALLALVADEALALRLASALIGIATVALTPWLAAALPWPHARRTGLVAAALLGGLFWHVLFSRFGIRAVSLPLLAALMGGWLWRGAASGQARDFALAGAALGAAIYAGTAARILPLVPALSLGWLAWTDRARAPQHLRGLALTLAVAALVVLPLAVYFATHPEQLTTHLVEVAVVGGRAPLAEGLAQLAANIPRVAGMFHVRGDSAWWRNLAGRPVFDPLAGVAFAVGLAASLRYPTAAVFCLTWLGVMLVPTLVADGAPNFSRAIGVLPVACIVAARGLVVGWAWLRARQAALATPALAGAVLVSAAWTAWDYFGVYAQRSEVYYAYDAEKVAAGHALRQAAEVGAVYATPSLAGHAKLRAVTRGVAVRAFDPASGVVVTDGPATYFAWAREGETDGPWWAAWRAAPVAVSDAQGTPLLEGYRLGQPPSPGEVRDAFGLRAGQTRFGGSIGLSGHRVEASGRVTLMWSALAPLARDLALFVHYVAADGQTAAQADGEPLRASYPTSRWQEGERIVEWRAPDRVLAPGVYRVRVGWYDRATGERLALPGSADNAFELGTVEVMP